MSSWEDLRPGQRVVIVKSSQQAESFHVEEPPETIRRLDIESIRLGGRAMHNTKRVGNRWFSAVAMTCLSGFALCGCTSGSRDLSSNLSETAGREAIEAERQVAERKKQETGGAKSKELLASKSRSTAPDSERAASKTTAPSKKPSARSEESASQASAEQDTGRVQLDDADLETADWAGDYLDRRVQSVSGEEEEGVLETTEPLLDRPRRQPAAADLFEEDEATAKVQKSTSRPEQRPGRASFDGTSEHPWSQKAPTTARSSTAKQSSTKRPSVENERLEATADSVPPVTPTPKAKSRTVSQEPADEAQQAEAKARVHTLLTQSKSLLNKGEHRSAFRVAQLAQRIADSENLFFGAGEEQPADIVRSVLMKIRSEEKQVAKVEVDSDGSSSRASQVASGTIPPGSPLLSKSEQWSHGDGQTEQPEQTALAENARASESTESSDNPWPVTRKKSTAQPVMRISPGVSSSGSRFNEQFPKSRPEWQGTANVPQTLTSPEEEASPGFATAKEGRMASDKIVQSKLHGSTTGADLASENSSSSQNEFVPAPFPAKILDRDLSQVNTERDREASAHLAVAEDWRTQDLNDVATSRQPLLVAPVAPLPPQEPLIPSVLAETGEDIFAVETHEPLPSQPQSKLWMILVAAAGAFAMLFVRRRPVPVVRASSDPQ